MRKRLYLINPFSPPKGGTQMTKDISHPDYYDCYEYHGNTTIELTRRQNGVVVWRDWIMFDSVEEATEYFNDACVLN
jgi:hypothetical protein